MYEARNAARHRPHTALYVLLLLPTLTLAVHTWVCCTVADLQRLTFIYLQQRCVGLLTSIVRQSLRHHQLQTHDTCNGEITPKDAHHCDSGTISQTTNTHAHMYVLEGVNSLALHA